MRKLPMITGLILVLFYILACLSPLVISLVISPETHHEFLVETGKGFALISFMILMLQPLLAGRFRWIERPFGLDIVIRFHKYAAILATVLLIAHPVLLATGKDGPSAVFGLNVPVSVYIGRIALVILLINMFLSLYNLPRGMKFEKWRVYHDFLGPFLLVLIFLHSLLKGKDLELQVMQYFWLGMLLIAVTAFLYHRIIRPRSLKKHPYRVDEVKQESDDVWTVKLVPPEGQAIYEYKPGQFQFITFYRDGDLPVEEHHWTISSSPSQRDYVSSTIKNLGDFTATIGQTKKGDTAVVHAPFGRFSYVFYPGEKDLVLLIGGIGITPVMSMLRHMRDTGVSIPVLLLYANKNENSIVFRDELSEMEKNESQSLKVVHVLEEPGEEWSGERGHIDREQIERYCGKDLTEKSFYLCGPPGTIHAAMQVLRELGVKDKQIHLEVFSFLT